MEKTDFIEQFQGRMKEVFTLYESWGLSLKEGQAFSLSLFRETVLHGAKTQEAYDKTINEAYDLLKNFQPPFQS